MGTAAVTKTITHADELPALSPLQHQTLGHTLAILWLTHPCKTFAAIIGLRHTGQSPSSLPLTFHKLSSCRLEAVSWQHCLKLFKSMMFKLEMTENFLWWNSSTTNKGPRLDRWRQLDTYLHYFSLRNKLNNAIITRRLSYRCYEYLGVALGRFFWFWLLWNESLPLARDSVICGWLPGV